MTLKSKKIDAMTLDEAIKDVKEHIGYDDLSHDMKTAINTLIIKAEQEARRKHDNSEGSGYGTIFMPKP